MERLEFESILEGKHISVPDDIIEKIGEHRHVDVILKLSSDSAQTKRDKEQTRMQAAFEEYKDQYPDDEVSLNDFKYVGILFGSEVGSYKDDVVDAVEGKYNDI
jgi:hypothetical protein